MNVSFDKRLELIFGLNYCVFRKHNIESNWVGQNDKVYNDKFYEMFEKGITPLLETFVLRGGFSERNICADIALHLDDDYNFINTDELNRKYNYQMLSELIKDFVAKSNYEDFYEKNKDYYESLSLKYKVALNIVYIFKPEMIEQFFGYSLGKPSIKLLNFTKKSYNIKRNEQITFVNGFEKKMQSKNLRFDDMLIMDFIHQYIHAYIDEYGRKFLKGLDLSNIVKEARKNNMKDEFSTDISFINESIAKAIKIMIVEKYFSQGYALKEIEKANNSGYIYTEELIKMLTTKNSYPSFDIFYLNVISTYFKDLNMKLEEENKTY